MFASRTILLGIAFAVLAIRGKREGLAGLLALRTPLRARDSRGAHPRS
jgi:hypothetical protein